MLKGYITNGWRLSGNRAVGNMLASSRWPGAVDHPKRVVGGSEGVFTIHNRKQMPTVSETMMVMRKKYT